MELLNKILDYSNIDKAYKQVVGNKSSKEEVTFLFQNIFRNLTGLCQMRHSLVFLLSNEPPSTRPAWFTLNVVKCLGGVRGAPVGLQLTGRLLDYSL